MVWVNFIVVLYMIDIVVDGSVVGGNSDFVFCWMNFYVIEVVVIEDVDV